MLNQIQQNTFSSVDVVLLLTPVPLPTELLCYVPSEELPSASFVAISLPSSINKETNIFKKNMALINYKNT